MYSKQAALRSERMALFERKFVDRRFRLGPQRPKWEARKRVRFGVRLSGHPRDLDVSELLDQRNRLLMEGLEVLRLDFPPAVQLVDQKSGIEAHAYVTNPPRSGRPRGL